MLTRIQDNTGFPIFIANEIKLGYHEKAVTLKVYLRRFEMDKNIQAGVGTRLRELRERRGWSLNDVSNRLQQASRCKISKERISDYEREVRATDIYTLEAFAQLYEVTLDYLWYGRGEREASYRKPSYDLQILRAIETLVDYGVIRSVKDGMRFYANQAGMLLDFAEECQKIFLSDDNRVLQHNRLNDLEEHYLQEIRKERAKNRNVSTVEEIVKRLSENNEAIYRFQLL